MADDRDRIDAEDIGRPADEELIGTGETLDDAADEEFEEIDESEQQKDEEA